MKIQTALFILIGVCLFNLFILVFRVNYTHTQKVERRMRDLTEQVDHDKTMVTLRNVKVGEENENIFLLSLVYSNINRTEQRKTIRDTWASRTIVKDSKHIVYFIINSNYTSSALSKILRAEMNEHEDIILFNQTRDDESRTEMTSFAFRWLANKGLRFQYFLKTDDDIFVNTDALIRYLQTTTPRTLFAVTRDVSSAVWFYLIGRSYYPPDSRLPSYVISGDVFYFFVREFDRYKMEIGTEIKYDMKLLEKFNVNLIENNAFNRDTDYQTVCEAKGLLTSNHLSGRQIWRYWRLLHDWGEFKSCDQESILDTYLYGEAKRSIQPVKQTRILEDIEQVQMLIDHPQKCAKPLDVFMFVAVISAPRHFHTRLAIRETWGRYFNPVKSATVVTLFFLGTTNDQHIQSRIEEENQSFGDILQGTFTDTYEHLIYKTMTLLHWVDKNCKSARYLIKVDDDVWLNYDHLLNLLSPAPRTNFTLGDTRITAPVLRSPKSKWYTPEEMYPSTTYKPYLSGPTYVLSIDLVRKILDASKKLQLFKWEDIYIGSVLHHIGVYTYSHIQFDMMGLSRSTCSLRACVMCHKYYTKGFLYYWNLIAMQERKNITCLPDLDVYISPFSILDKDLARKPYWSRDLVLRRKMAKSTNFRSSHNMLCHYYGNKNTPIYLIIVIFSDPLNFDIRKYSRLSYATPRVVNGKVVQPFFVVGSAGNYDTWKLLEHEDDINADLIILDMLDIQENEALKFELTLRWLQQSCPGYKYLMKTTDNEYINIENTIHYLMTSSRTKFAVGNVVTPNATMYASETTVSKLTMPYLQREVFIFSFDVVDRVTRSLPWKQPIRSLGIVLGELLFNHSIGIVHHGDIMLHPPNINHGQNYCILHDILVCSNFKTFKYLIVVKILSGEFHGCNNYPTYSSKYRLPWKQQYKHTNTFQIGETFGIDDDDVTNPHDFNYIINHEEKCRFYRNEGLKNMIILIDSRPGHFEYRRFIRLTWSKTDKVKLFKFTVLFLLGDVDDKETERLIILENARYGDIIQEDFDDTSGSNTIKTIMGLKWAATFCPDADFIVMATDNIFININRLIEHLESPFIQQNAFLAGSTIENKTDVYSAHTYVLSSDVVHTLYVTSLNMQISGNPSIYLTQLVKEAGFYFKNLVMFQKRPYSNTLDEYLSNYHITWEVQTPEDMTSLHVVMKPVESFFEYDQEKVNEPGRYNFIITNHKKCQNRIHGEEDIVIVVFSSCSDSSWRMAARHSWIQNIKMVKDFHIFVLFVLGKCSQNINELVQEEAYKYRDIIQGDFDDGAKYTDTFKMYITLRWLSTFCNPIKFFIKLQQSVFLNKMHLILQLKANKLKNIFMGNVIANQKTQRDENSYTFVPYFAWPYDVLPGYPSAEAYVISYDLVQDLYAASYYADLVANEAVFLSLLMERLGVHITHLPQLEVKTIAYPNHDSKHFAWKTLSEYDYRKIHNSDKADPSP